MSCVVVCDLEVSLMGGHSPRWAAAPQIEEKDFHGPVKRQIEEVLKM